MSEEYEEVKPAELNPGDVVHVSFKSGAEQSLYLNEKVIVVRDSYVNTEGGRSFWTEYSRFYLVEKAKKSLPTELGAVVEHNDGWRFMRVDEDRWVGVGTVNCSGETIWTDEELILGADGDSNWEVVA